MRPADTQRLAFNFLGRPTARARRVKVPTGQGGGMRWGNKQGSDAK